MGASQPTDCPLTAALDAIGGKWSMICLRWLAAAPRRLNEFHRLMPDSSHKVLTATLRNLERERLICRTDFAQLPPRVEYRISTHGDSVRPLIEAVRLWGRAHLSHKSP
jgi:DNA-binding HxlR family transcriptional regulator